jgi:hypothetical protein
MIRMSLLIDVEKRFKAVLALAVDTCSLASMQEDPKTLMHCSRGEVILYKGMKRQGTSIKDVFYRVIISPKRGSNYEGLIAVSMPGLHLCSFL